MNYHRFRLDNEDIVIPLIADVKKLYIELTTECNYSCITCIRHAWQDTLSSLPEMMLDRILHDMNGLPHLKSVHFGGFGEPLLHPNTLQMIAACKARGYEVEMITNGSLLTPEVMEGLISAGLDWLYVSLDGSDAESFSHIRPGASFNAVTQNIMRLQDLKHLRKSQVPKLGVEFVATKQNVDRLPAMRQVINTLGAHRFIITNVMPYHESMKEQILYDQRLQDADEYLLPVQPIFKKMPEMQLRTQRSCSFINDKALTITAQGNVSPCYAFMHSYDCFIFGRKKHTDAFYFGNIANRSLADIWTDAEYARFRWIVKHSLYPSCTDCRQVEGCATALTNEADCWGNHPSCADCLWARSIVLCP